MMGCPRDCQQPGIQETPKGMDLKRGSLEEHETAKMVKGPRVAKIKIQAPYKQEDQETSKWLEVQETHLSQWKG
jgi:hypothetical protein